MSDILELFATQAAQFPNAVCATVDPDLPFAHESETFRRERAKENCRACTHIAECLELAITRKEQHGIWGGLDEDERKSLVRRRNRQRDSTHCRRGHEWSETAYTDSHGDRQCRACRRLTQNRNAKKRRLAT